MKPATGTLATFLVNAKSLVYVDLYTITLNGGSVIRWCSGDLNVAYGGNTFTVGPIITDSGSRSRRGIQVDTLDIQIFADANTTINGVPLLTFIRQAGLDGATIRVDRAMGSDWSNIVGGYLRFAGRISEIKDLTKTSVTLGCSTWMELLNVNMPTNVLSVSCINPLYGSACTLNKATYATAGTVSTGTNTASVFSSTGTTSHGANWFDLGYVVFTSGANNGVLRTIKSQDASGNISLVVPLPSAPANGDTFTAYPGCRKSQSECSTKFGNLANFRGFPYIPPPETAT
jgi:uncharacterized phage protein (TIGR02218 family)